jgi:hypothetical protein
MKMTDIFVAKVLVFGPRKATPKLNFMQKGVARQSRVKIVSHLVPMTRNFEELVYWKFCIYFYMIVLKKLILHNSSPACLSTIP